MKGRAKFYFGDIVVVAGALIGCVVKTWHNDRIGYQYEVYVRSFNQVQEYGEKQIQRYIVSKELTDDEKDFHV